MRTPPERPASLPGSGAFVLVHATYRRTLAFDLASISYGRSADSYVTDGRSLNATSPYRLDGTRRPLLRQLHPGLRPSRCSLNADFLSHEPSFYP